MGNGATKEEQLYQAVQNGNHNAVKALRRDGAALEVSLIWNSFSVMPKDDGSVSLILISIVKVMWLVLGDFFILSKLLLIIFTQQNLHCISKSMVKH
jgi:hypothetical protein